MNTLNVTTFRQYSNNLKQVLWMLEKLNKIFAYFRAEHKMEKKNLFIVIARYIFKQL